MKLPELTPAQQAAAVDRSGENISLTSGAGCGKTFVLARRFTELLMTSRDENPLSRLVALTFTEKAALEMRQRVRRLLRTLADSAGGQDRRKLLRWIEELPEARISTIHAFCSGLLRTHAIEAGIDPGFSVCADQLLSSKFVARSTEEAVLSAVEDARGDVAELVGELGLSRLGEVVTGLLGMRTRADLSGYADPTRTFARWEEQLQDERVAAFGQLERDGEIGKLIDRIAEIPCADPEDKLAGFREEKLALARALVNDPAARRPRFFEEMARKPGNVGGKKAWGPGVAKQVRDLLKDLAARFERYAPYAEDLSLADEQAANSLATLTQLALDAQEALRARMRRQGLLSFDDLLLLAGRVVRENPSIRRGLSGGIDQMLIDESQDTDAFQLSLLLGILFDSDQLQDVQPGRLFLVGDAKQSIYRFRGAQVDVFRDICHRLGEQQRESLDISFRTHRAGIEFVNHLFGGLMSEEYRPIRAHRQVCPPEPSVEVLLASPRADAPPFRRAEETIAAQAAVTAERIERMVADREKRVWDAESGTWRATRYGDVAILFSRMTNSLAFERELARRDLPYYVVAGTGLFQQQEVYDVLNALRAIANPLDDVAVCGVLRSSLVGLDDNALMKLAETCDGPYLPALQQLRDSGRRIGLSNDDRHAVLAAADWLDQLHRKSSAVGIDELLEDVLQRTGYEATLLTRPHGRRLVGNVRRVVEFARTAQADGISLPEFLAQMGEQVLNQQRAEQACVAGEAENVVRLMTVHQAKGLEFPVVVLPDLNVGLPKPTAPVLHRRDWGITTSITAAGADDESPEPLSHRLSLQGELNDSADENLRRLYVAITRHEDHLVFVGADWRTKEGGIRSGDSDLAILDEALGITPALEAGREEIAYAGDELALRVAAVPAPNPPRRKESGSAGRKLLAASRDEADFARQMVSLGVPSSDGLGPLPCDVARAELAVTALSEFAHCPQLYRYRYELRMPDLPRDTPDTSAPATPRRNATGLSPMMLGTVYHRCMELLDFTSPQSADVLVSAVVGELDLADRADLGVLTDELDEMLATLAESPLLATLQNAPRTLRELDFLMDVDTLRLRGQIDLILRDAGGDWRIVDYKSDRLNPGESWAQRAGKYALQLQAYALAAKRHLGVAPAGALLYSLRTGETWEMPLADLAAARDELVCVGRELVASRRAKHFAPRPGSRCEYCPYAAICPGQSAG